MRKYIYCLFSLPPLSLLPTRDPLTLGTSPTVGVCVVAVLMRARADVPVKVLVLRQEEQK
jgi:hypothetical protein